MLDSDRLTSSAICAVNIWKGNFSTSRKWSCCNVMRTASTTELRVEAESPGSYRHIELSDTSSIRVLVNICLLGLGVLVSPSKAAYSCPLHHATATYTAYEIQVCSTNPLSFCGIHIIKYYLTTFPTVSAPVDLCRMQTIHCRLFLVDCYLQTTFCRQFFADYHLQTTFYRPSNQSTTFQYWFHRQHLNQ